MLEPSNRMGAFAHGFTYSGHPVAAAVALRNLQLFEELDLVAHAARVGERFQQRLAGFLSLPFVGHIRGKGLLGGLELVDEHGGRKAFTPAAKAAIRVAALALEEGLMVRALAGDVIAICPPLVITDAQVDELFDALERALKRFADERAKAGPV